MPLTDLRFTVLQVINEVQRKLGLDATTALATNKLSIQLVDFVNDICNELSDYGNWQEMLVSANITAVSGQSNYSINTSANVKNIADLYFTPRTGPMRNVSIQEMRILTRVTSTGTPSQFSIFGTDANANPNIRVRPTPVAAQDGQLFSVLYYVKAPTYTLSDGAVIIPFPGNVVIDGVYAKATLNENGGAPNDKYNMLQQQYLEGRKEALNRFNSDTGWDVSFSPSIRGRRR